LCYRRQEQRAGAAKSRLNTKKISKVSRCGQITVFGASIILRDRQAVLHQSNQGGNKMNPGTKDEIEGRVHEVKGTIKEKIGEITNDPDLEGEGIGEKITGKVQKKIGEIETAVEKP
jgi:uncharacterized protein YjbJ (UPF0337 family)